MAVADRSVTSRTIAQHIESVTHYSVSAGTIRRHLQQSGLSTRRSLLGLPLTQNHRRLRRQWYDERRITHCRYFKQSALHLRGVGASCPSLPLGLATAIFQQNSVRPLVARIVHRLFVNHQLELLPWPARSPDLSLIENMWSMVAQPLTQITPPAATPDQLWLRMESAWSSVPQEHIQSLFESMPRSVAEDQARRRFVEWAQNEIAVVPDFHKRILVSDEAHFWFNGYVNKQNCRIWSEANPQVYVKTPLHPEKQTVQSMVIGIEP
ncbi:transposable element Tcb1 transposase [Trichonephila clavipes]|nr:transposable element Tcb1 transposase [Trichonephila clavipes]